MILHSPFIITSRLMPGVSVGDATISIGYGRSDRDGRTVYDVWIDLPDGTESHVTDLRSGCQGGTLQDGLASLCTFLSASAESYDYRQRTGRATENEDLFEPSIVEWASTCDNAIADLSMTLEEAEQTGTALIEE